MIVISKINDSFLESYEDGRAEESSVFLQYSVLEEEVREKVEKHPFSWSIHNKGISHYFESQNITQMMEWINEIQRLISLPFS